MEASSLIATPHQQAAAIILVCITSVTILMNIVFRRMSFRRVDSSNGNQAPLFEDTLRGSLSILSNGDSVLNRAGVKGSIEGYERLFDGARQSVGSISSKESVALREKEYKTMVNSFYDLVTDFYEWGWGQVRERKSNRKCLCIVPLFFCSNFAFFFFAVVAVVVVSFRSTIQR